jgi:hypothetical protein
MRTVAGAIFGPVYNLASLAAQEWISPDQLAIETNLSLAVIRFVLSTMIKHGLAERREHPMLQYRSRCVPNAAVHATGVFKVQ